jgi:beta-glucanase (GH16 family)
MSYKKTTHIKENILAAVIVMAAIVIGASAIFGKSAPVVTKPAQPVQQAPVVSAFDPATKDWTYDFSTAKNGALSSKDWRFELGPEKAQYHNELQTYTADTSNVRVQDGVLVIEARKQARDGKQYTSARVSTLDNFSFTYGTLEVDMMLPQGNGTWPAAWLMPRSNKYTPEALGIAKDDKLAWAINGEIDFAEAIGSLPGQNLPTIHSYYELQRKPTYSPAFIKDQYTQFHRYGVIKTPTKITFTLDGVPYASREKSADSPLEWPFDQPYYLILNLAIGGDWAGAHGIDDASAPWQLKIKSITYKP